MLKSRCYKKLVIVIIIYASHMAGVSGVHDDFETAGLSKRIVGA